MKRKSLVVSSCIAAVGLAMVVGSVATAQPSGEPKKPAMPAAPAKPAAPAAPAKPAMPATPAKPEMPAKPGMPEMKLPAGWTEADMQACMAAGMPGEMHKKLASIVGDWKGTNSMWMAPETEAMKSECTVKFTQILDGHFVQCDWQGDMMGPYHGMGASGYDNVSQKFVTTWIDNHSTGMASGTGEMSADGKTLTWQLTFNCPMTKKPATMREVQTLVDDKTLKIEMFTTDPKSGKEFKMMSAELKKQG